MKLGEVSLLTNDVIKLADFYKELLEIDNKSNDSVHQTIIREETMLTIYNDGSIKKNDIKMAIFCMSQSENKITFNKGYTENGFAEKVFHLHLRHRR